MRLREAIEENQQLQSTVLVGNQDNTRLLGQTMLHPPNVWKKILIFQLTVVRRFELMYGNGHGLSYVLDPTFLGETQTQPLKRTLKDILVNFPVNDFSAVNDTRREALYLQYSEFMVFAQQDKFAKTLRYRMLVEKRQTGLQYWQVHGSPWPFLQDIALRLFTMATSSALSERNFSTFGFFHSKLQLMSVSRSW